MKNVQRGFTLIELIIVVAIIGIVASLVVPRLDKYRLTHSTDFKRSQQSTNNTQHGDK